MTAGEYIEMVRAVAFANAYERAYASVFSALPVPLSPDAAAEGARACAEEATVCV